MLPCCCVEAYTALLLPRGVRRSGVGACSRLLYCVPPVHQVLELQRIKGRVCQRACLNLCVPVMSVAEHLCSCLPRYLVHSLTQYVLCVAVAE